jgi:hypothetical protein
MEVSHEINEIAIKIAKVSECGYGKAHITFSQGVFDVIHSTTKTLPIDCFATLKCEEAKQGLTITDWNRLENKVAKKIKEYELWQASQKH